MNVTRLFCHIAIQWFYCVSLDDFNMAVACTGLMKAEQQWCWLYYRRSDSYCLRKPSTPSLLLADWHTALYCSSAAQHSHFKEDVGRWKKGGESLVVEFWTAFFDKWSDLVYTASVNGAVISVKVCKRMSAAICNTRRAGKLILNDCVCNWITALIHIAIVCRNNDE